MNATRFYPGLYLPLAVGPGQPHQKKRYDVAKPSFAAIYVDYPKLKAYTSSVVRSVMTAMKDSEAPITDRRRGAVLV